MKNLILSLLLFICFTAGAQNRLVDLYTLNAGDHYPADMPHVKQWINTTLAPIFIRNLQFSDNTRSSSKFLSFNPVVRPGTIWPLGASGLKLIPNPSALRGQYDQDILSYLHDFDIVTFDYQHRSYFLMARNVLRITDDQMLANTLNYFIDFGGKKSKYQQLIDQVNKVKKLKLSYAAPENVHELGAILQQKYPGKIADVIFDCYINGKNDEETQRNMQHFYNVTGFFQGPLESRIDELMQPKLQFRQEKAPIIQLPATALKLNGKPDSLAQFSVETGSAVLNYHKRQLEVIFKGKMNAEAEAKTLKVVDYDYKTGKTNLSKLPPSASPQTITELWLTISEKGIQLIGVTTDYGRYMLIDEPWK